MAALGQFYVSFMSVVMPHAPPPSAHEGQNPALGASGASQAVVIIAGMPLFAHTGRGKLTPPPLSVLIGTNQVLRL